MLSEIVFEQLQKRSVAAYAVHNQRQRRGAHQTEMSLKHPRLTTSLFVGVADTGPRIQAAFANGDDVGFCVHARFERDEGGFDVVVGKGGEFLRVQADGVADAQARGHGTFELCTATGVNTVDDYGHDAHVNGGLQQRWSIVAEVVDVHVGVDDAVHAVLLRGARHVNKGAFIKGGCCEAFP